MSHFAVLVIGNVQEQLAPFDENLKVKWVDETAKVTKGYKTKKVEAVVLPGFNPKTKRYTDKILGTIYDSQFRTYNTPSEWHSQYGSEGLLIPHKAKIKQKLLSKVYPSFDDYLKNWCGYSPGKIGHWENPNAKWDWYVEGGRFAGKLKVKGDSTPLNTAKAGDLDFDAMFKSRVSEYSYWWNKAQAEPVELRQLYHGIAPTMTREQYLDLAKNLPFFAVVKDGKWYEKGKMGWWAVVTDPKDDADWQKELDMLLKSLRPDEQVTVVDCHI